MNTLSLFSIGFRAETICRVLREYQSGKPANRFIVDESQRVITECSQLIDPPVESLKENRRTYGDYLPLLYEAFGAAQVDKVQGQVAQALATVTDVADAKPGVDVSPALGLFERLSEVCITKTSQAPYPRVTFI